MSDRGGVFTLADLTPDPRNPRRHTERNIAMIARSLQQFGAGRGIVVDENFQVLAGNGVVDAAAEVGIERVNVVEVDGDELVVIQVGHLSEEDKVKYAIADNRTSETSGWDADELRAMVDDGLSLDMFWTTEEREALLATSPYRPVLEPVSKWEPVTQEAVESKQHELESRYESPSTYGEIVELTCPECGKSFVMRR